MGSVNVLDWFYPTGRQDAPAALRKKYDAWERFAQQAYEYYGNILWLARPGFGYREALQTGMCHESCGALEGEVCAPADQNGGCWVFWIPRVRASSFRKPWLEQLYFFGQLKARYGLGLSTHTRAPGSLAVGLTLAHLHLTGERVPLGMGLIRTETEGRDGRMLHLGFHGDSGLRYVWGGVADRDEALGFFPTGIESV